MGETISSFKELRVYQAAFRLQQEIFEVSKSFPKAEQYSLTDQIRRASRSVGANIAEAWQKRRYPAHFISKLSDADGELAETQHWIETAASCAYLTAEQRKRLVQETSNIGSMLGSMMTNPEKFCPKS